MSHSLAKIWIHLVTGTKNRAILIPQILRAEISDQITHILEQNGCRVCVTVTVKDHFHSLFLLSPTICIADLVRSIKGSVSYRLNRENAFKSSFMWQTGYGAFSVSESGTKKVEQYIRTQEAHHRRMSYQEEYERFMRIYYPELMTHG